MISTLAPFRPNLPFRFTLRSLVQELLALWANGEQGWWYDPSDLSTLYQDAAGTQPVTAMEQFVGLILDKRKGLQLGPELVGAFDFTDGWALVGAPSPLTATSFTTASSGGVRKNIGIAAGKWYSVTVTIANTSTVGVYVDSMNNYAITAGTERSVTFKMYAVDATGLYFRNAAAGTTTVTAISVRELPGNHAYQPTLTKRMKVSRRVNLLTKTEQFDDAVWKMVRASVSGNKLIEDLLTGVHSISISNGQLQNIKAGQSFVYSISVKAAERTQVRVLLLNASGTFGAIGSAIFNIENGTVVSSTNAEVFSLVAISAEDDGWFRITIRTIPANEDTALTVSSDFFRLSLFWGGTDSYAGDGVSGVHIDKASLTLSIESHLPYQWVNTDTDYDDDPSKFPTYLKPDVIDDCYITNDIDLTGTDKINVWAGITKLSDAAVGYVVDFDDALLTGNRAFLLRAPVNAGFTNIGFSSGGTALMGANSAGYASPVSVVIAGAGDISGDSTVLFVNGTKITENLGDQGVGNFKATKLNIGSRHNSTLFFNGKIYPMLGRGALSNASQHAAVNQYIKQKMMLP